MSTSPSWRPRPATVADAEGVFRLLTGFATSYRPDPAVFASAALPRVLDEAAAGRGEFLVVGPAQGETQAGADPVVGYALAARVPTLFAGGSVLELLELAVDERLRGRGAGSALVRALLDRAAAAGDREVTVPTRRAAAFYRRLGFTETAAYLKRSPGL